MEVLSSFEILQNECISIRGKCVILRTEILDSLTPSLYESYDRNLVSPKAWFETEIQQPIENLEQKIASWNEEDLTEEE